MKRVSSYISHNEDTEFRALMDTAEVEINNNKILGDTLETQIRDVEGPLSKFVQLKTTVIYFKIDIGKDFELHGNADFFSAHNPNIKNRYEKINDFVIIMDAVDSSSEFSEETLNDEGEITSTVKILPNTIEPHHGDMFIMKYLNKNSLWRVTEVSPLNSEENLIYQLSVELKERNYDSKSFFKKKLEEAVISEYHFKYEHYGTKFKTIITDEENNYTNSFKEFYKELAKYYDDTFFDEYTSTYVCEHEGDFLIDEMLNTFLLKTETLMVNPDIKIPTIFNFFENKDYEKTIFSAITKKDKNRLKKYKCSLISKKTLCLGENTLLFGKSIVWYDSEYSLKKFDQFDQSFLNIFLEDVKSTVAESDLLTNFSFVNLVNKLINGYMISNNKGLLLEIKELYNVLKTLGIKSYGLALSQDNIINCFYYIPLILYVIKNYLMIILNKNF